MSAGATILIVDDEPFNVDYLEQELEDLGYRTVSAVNGQEALDRVAADPPDLILLDVMRCSTALPPAPASRRGTRPVSSRSSS